MHINVMAGPGDAHMNGNCLMHVFRSVLAVASVFQDPYRQHKDLASWSRPQHGLWNEMYHFGKDVPAVAIIPTNASEFRYVAAFRNEDNQQATGIENRSHFFTLCKNQGRNA